VAGTWEVSERWIGLVNLAQADQEQVGIQFGSSLGCEFWRYFWLFYAAIG